jgi:Arc/MetJ family transcription regulator
MSRSSPPRYVPTLTDVVQPSQQPAAAESVVSVTRASAELQDQLVQRVMQRLDLVLERRLRETLAAAVIEQTRTVTPTLREEIEAMVRQMVAEALKQELAGRSS